jgi:uncharacterized protein with NRDE domain
VTNIREGIRHSHSHRSRGWLVRDYLLGNALPQDYLAAIAGQAAEYAGFNLLLGDGEELWYGNNRGLAARSLEPGVYGLSNHLLDTPWPKVVRTRKALAELLGHHWFHQEQAFAIMSDTTPAPDSTLPDTGIPLEWERALSATFILKNTYGTRCTTFYQRANTGRYHLTERRFKGPPHTWNQGTFTW